jgi:hypothetical protein
VTAFFGETAFPGQWVHRAQNDRIAYRCSVQAPRAVSAR